MKQRFIEGIVRVVTPVHIASMSDSGKSGDKNIIHATKMQVFTKGGARQAPYIPGNDLRGRMRRRAAHHILSRVQPVPLAIYHALTCGANNAAPESGSKSVSQLIQSRDDLYLGVFGGGPRLHKSGMRVRNLVPITTDMIEVGAAPGADEPDGRYEEIAKVHASQNNDKLTNTFNFIRRDDAVNGQDMRAPLKIRDYAAALAAWESNLIDNKDAKQKGKDAEQGAEKTKKLGLSNIMSVEAICTGVKMYLRIDFDDYLTDAQVGFAARCLQDVLNEPIGGWVRAGFGVIELDGELALCEVDDDGLRTTRSFSHFKPLPGAEQSDEILDQYTLEKLESLLIMEGGVLDERGLLVPPPKKSPKDGRGKSAASTEE